MLLVRGEDPLPVERELERLSSTEGLYTGPQIRAQAGFALTESAYAHAALAALGERVARISPDTLGRLRADPQEGPIEEAWGRALLVQSGAVEPAVLSAAQLRGLEASIPPRTDAAERVLLHADLLDLADAAGTRTSARIRRAARAAVVATRADDDPAVQLARVTVLQRLGARPDDRLRAVARGEGLRAPADDISRVVRAAAILAATRFATPDADPTAPAQALVAAAVRAPTPAAVWLAIRTLDAAGAEPPDELKAVAARLRAALGRHHAVPERAVFPTIPKAVWLVARIRRELGRDGLPDDRVVELSQVLASPEMRRRDDPESYGLLLAAAKLAGLSYEGPGVGPPPAPPSRVRDATDAFIWNQRARLGVDLGRAPAPATVQPFVLRDDVEFAALGALLHGAREIRADVRVPAELRRRFVQGAPLVRYRDTRWLLYAAGGLAAVGRTEDAGRLLGRSARVGCRDYPHLVRDLSGSCDLESTLLLLELRSRVPAANRLARKVAEKP